jgi:NAD(P)-dependent dehydrogenase (short-subunit alcohol dehydrogenase family)
VNERRRALVTGGNRGIGFAIARGLAKAGLDVTIGARDAKAGETAAHEIGCASVVLDVADHTAIPAAVAKPGPFDVLVNNAGVLHHVKMLDDPDDFAECMNVMVHGPYHLIRACLPHMAERGYGRIVNVSSRWGAFSEGITAPGGYGVAKAALNALTLALSHQLPDTIKINSMCPGWVRSRMGGAGATRSLEEGADTAVWLATLPENGPTGGFFRDRKPVAW